MMGWFSWPKIIAALAIVGAVLAAMLKLIGLGRTQERAKQQAATIDLQRRMQDANAAGPHTADDVDKRLRDGQF